MGVVVPAGFAQVSMQYFLEGDAEPMVTTWGVDAGTEDDPTALADEFFTNMVDSGTRYDPDSMSSLWTIGPAVASIMTGTGPQIGTGTLSREGTNSVVVTVPNNCSWLVQKRTSRGGRRGRGRAFLPPADLHEGNVTATGDITGSFVTSMQTGMTTFLLAQEADGHPLVLLHSEDVGLLVPDPITSLVVQSKIATQRTRMRR